MTGWDEALLDQGHLNLHAAAAPLCRPTKILLVRHGESRGNRDETAYAHCPDWKIPLTRRGWGDARLAGERVKEVVGDAPLLFYCSPYRRTKQTLAGMMGALETNDIIGAREEPRLTEQQFGNFQNVLTTRQSKDERARFGRFYYRFPQGESGLDVYNRSTSFIATMHRDMANPALARPGLHSVIVTHGLTLRLFLMRWFQYSVEDFEESHNPPNGGVVIMEKVSDPQGRHEWYELTDDSLELLKFKRQHRYGSLWKLLDGLPQVDELGEDDDGSDCFEDNYYFNPDEDSIE
eukprot:CAMPEP_0206367104 /NCGR_PEP_ID=MMETSP0294-20121207/3846_1 /ASSEMBLY_ACC=CAM_ASM_000327 /TAXON_ID=39354 /ORGANISM="Heterosigma akashiwo, Strain CCMP2393" /LENGTH=291 /DNA_ID=CAMNT_0053813291 /DNA_START=154 /DNA_END=1029 /DNA_ORIENTATION=-